MSDSLYRIVKDAIDAGWDRGEAITELELLFETLQADGTEAQQDAVTDVLDALTNQCGPGLAI